MKDLLKSAEIIVIKVGSHLVVDEQLRPNLRFLNALAGDMNELLKLGKGLLLVSSGAVALGARRQRVGYPQKLATRQALAAMGQIELCSLWQRHLGRLGRELGGKSGNKTAQVLLTLEDNEARRRYLNARSTLRALLDMRVVPIINENDTVATDELRFGDNDRLAARVAQMSGADCLVLLSTVDGLYDQDPRGNGNARHIAVVEQIDEDVIAKAGGGGGDFSSGGMRTKLQAARIATSAGCEVAIAGGLVPHPLLQLESGGRHTRFPPRIDKLTAHKRWIAGLLSVGGEIVIDRGAAAALKRGASLLPVGAMAVRGGFERGDLVLIKDESGRVLARGLAALALADAEKVLGLNSAGVAATLGFSGREELVHRDNLVLNKDIK